MKAKVLAGILIFVLIAMTVAVKLIFFPSIKDDYFTMNQRSLRQAPSGLVVVRTTHFPKTLRKGVINDNVQRFGKDVWRMMGRNVTFQELIAEAYGREADRVVLPVGAPQTNFDFLVTASGDQRQQLQTAIRKKLGYIAHPEMRDEEVLAMKIQNTSLPGLTVSAADSKPDVNLDNGRLHFTHMHLQEVTGGLEQMLKTPVVDKTALTNFYDFSVQWNAKMQQQLQDSSTAANAIKTILSGWGLVLVPDSAQVEMLVVRSAG